jgi:hypothetical protein
MKAKCMQCGGSTKKMKTGGAKGKCPFGQCWDDINEVCNPCPSSTYGTLGAASGVLAVGSKMIGSAIKKGQAKKQAKKEINKSVDNAVSTAKKSSIMKTGGTVKKMQMGGPMGIVGMPKYSNDPRTDAGRTLKKGGSVTKAKFGAYVKVQHSPAPGRVRSSSGTGTVPVGMRKKKGGSVKK